MNLLGTSLAPQMFVSLKHCLMGFPRQYKTSEFLVFGFISLATRDSSTVARCFAKRRPTPCERESKTKRENWPNLILTVIFDSAFGKKKLFTQ